MEQMELFKKIVLIQHFSYLVQLSKFGKSQISICICIVSMIDMINVYIKIKMNIMDIMIHLCLLTIMTNIFLQVIIKIIWNKPWYLVFQSQNLQ